MREVGGVKLVQLKNPWARVRWKGAYSMNDTARWTPELRRALQYDQTSALQVGARACARACLRAGVCVRARARVLACVRAFAGM